MKVIHAHPGVPTFVKQTALAYYDVLMLEKFYTTFVSHPGYWLSGTLEMVPGLKRELLRRSAVELPFGFISTHPAKELLRTFCSRCLTTVIADAVWEKAEIDFDHWVSKRITGKAIDGVHVYEHAGLATLKKARAMGIAGIYEQPSQHHAFFTPIAKEQVRRYPELRSAGTDLLTDDKSKRRNERRDQELMISSLVICNSTFTRKTLLAAGVAEAKIRVIPYGFPVAPEELPERTENAPLVFLNAGTQNLRKGLHVLYRAWRRCNFSEKEAELWLIGKMSLPTDLLNDLPGKVVVRNSIPREELLLIYHQADVFVLPTLADGFGMVISEAMSRGLTVITTENSGGSDIIKEGFNGLFAKAGDVDSLANQMKWCVENRRLVAAMGKEAWATSKRYQWTDYRRNVSARVSDHLMDLSEEK